MKLQGTIKIDYHIISVNCISWNDLILVVV